MGFGQGPGGGSGGRGGNPFGNNPFTNQPPPTVATGFGAPPTAGGLPPGPTASPVGNIPATNVFGAPPSASGFGQAPPTNVYGSPTPSGPFGNPPATVGHSNPAASAAGFGGAVASPLEGNASRTTGFLLQTGGGVPQLPPVCACCTSPAQLAVRVAKSRKTGRYTSETRAVQVPYCARCKAHLDATRRRNVTLGLITALVGGVAPVLLASAWIYAPAPLILFVGAIVSLGLGALLGGMWKEPPVAREAGCCANHNAFEIQSFGGPIVNLRLFNARFAQQVAQMNHTNALPVAVRAPISPRWVLPPILAFVAAIPSYVLTHGVVYFDNPSQVPLTFVVDGGEENFTVAPGAHDHTHVPIGERDIVVQMNGAMVDRFTGDVDPATDHVATPLGTNCYATLEAAYGTAALYGRTGAQMQSGQRWYTLSRVDFVLEPFPGTVQLGRGEHGAIKRRFARVDCTTGRAVP